MVNTFQQSLQLKSKELTKLQLKFKVRLKETPTFNTTATNANGDKIAITQAQTIPLSW